MRTSNVPQSLPATVPANFTLEISILNSVLVSVPSAIVANRNNGKRCGVPPFQGETIWEITQGVKALVKPNAESPLMRFKDHWSVKFIGSSIHEPEGITVPLTLQ